MILIPKHRDIILPNAGTRVAGYVRMRKGRGQVITGDTGWFSNIITNNGLDGLATEGVELAAQYCHVGTGTASEAATDTALGTFVASHDSLEATSNAIQASAPYYGKWTRTFRFNPGTATGNIAEVGLSTQATNGGLFSRARVKDGGGSPTTITVLADEWLDVSYEVRLYPDHINSDGSTNDGTGSISLSGTSYSYTLRPAYITNLTYWSAATMKTGFNLGGASSNKAYGSDAALGAVTSEPAATSTSGLYFDSSVSQTSYSSGTYSRNATLSIGLDDGNVTGGIAAILYSTYLGAYQILFGSAIPKDNTKTMTFVIQHDWTRATIP